MWEYTRGKYLDAGVHVCDAKFFSVMPELDPGIHDACPHLADSQWIAGSSPAMTSEYYIGRRNQLSRKERNFLDLEGCFSFRNAFASIWRMRSRVTENCWPTSSSVWSVFMPMPKRIRSTRSSRGVSEANTRVVVSRKFDWIAASIGRIAFLSSMKSPRCESSSSPIGVSKEIGSFAIFNTLRTLATGMSTRLSISSDVGSL